jgi:predicted glycosyltransferase
VTILPCYGTSPIESIQPHPAIRILESPIELVDLLPTCDLVVSRAGRNTTAEVLAYRKRAILIPISQDPLRGAEQRDNAVTARAFPNVRVVPIIQVETADFADIVVSMLEIPVGSFSYDFPIGNEVASRLIRKVVVS